MPRAIELLKQGRYGEIWQMCCGYLQLDISQFMDVQRRLLFGQIDLLNHSGIGQKIMGNSFPTTVQEFRESVPLTDYSAYCPELVKKNENCLPEKPSEWVHTSGRTGEFPCKWIPISPSYKKEMEPILYGIGLLASSNYWGDCNPFIKCPNFMYSVAPRPFMSGALANMLQAQTPNKCFPDLASAENLPFEERIRLGFEQALSERLDFFFGLSLVLSAIGRRFTQSTNEIAIHSYLSHPKAIMRLCIGMLKSHLAGRKLLPKDLWKIKGIVTSGLDSSFYREEIKELWGRYPLDIYSTTEGGIIATQIWDYGNMSFIPNLNFFEFIPEKEHMKWQIDHKYEPKTVLMDEVNAGEVYEIVITSLHGGSLVRYRIGDMIRITSLLNETLGIDIPQMLFERRADDLLDFAAIRLNEKAIWQAIEATGASYEDWVAFKNPGEMVLNILLEPRHGETINKNEFEKVLFKNILMTDREVYKSLKEQSDLNNMIKFKMKLTLLPEGSFTRFINERKAEGADLAHLKPPHINPPPKVLSSLLQPIAKPSEFPIKIPVKPLNAPIS